MNVSSIIFNNSTGILGGGRNVWGNVLKNKGIS